MPDQFVALDLETTGLSPETDRIIEVGATRFDRFGAVETFQTFVDPGRSIPIEVQELTGIVDADLVGAPRFTEVREALEAFIGDRAIVGQNIAFDLAFLDMEQLRLPGPSFDTWELASVLLPTAGRLNLGAIAELLGIPMPVSHRALADAEATRDVFLALATRLEAMPRSLLVELHTFARRASWGIGVLIEDALARTGSIEISEAEAAALLASLTPPPVRRTFAPLVPNEEQVPVTAEEVDAVFRLAAAREDLFPAYERRPSQEEMARVVARHLVNGGHAAVEAGTGTGKSLAYLVPSMLYALRNNDRVVVSTHTLNLQDQLASRDAPAALRLVETAEEAEGALRVSVLKGRSNYLCLERWAQVRLDPAERGEAEARLFARVAAWLPQTETGDLAELYMTSQEQPWWPQISAGDSDCLARRCSYVREGSCFLLRARQRAAASHLVIVNHSLLLANAARDDQVLPPFSHLVIDEAHRLEDVATQHYGASLSIREARDLVEVLGTGERHGTPGLARRLHLLAGGDGGMALSPVAGLAPVGTSLDVAVQGTRDHVRTLADTLRAFVDETQPEGATRAELSLTAGRRSQASWEDVEQAALNLDLGFHILGERVVQVRDTIGGLPEGTLAEPDVEAFRGECARHLEALAGARELLRQVVLRPDHGQIAWVSRNEGDLRLSRAPLEVAEHLEADLYAGRESVLATSATLQVDGRFDFALERLGLPEADTLVVPSPFDYRSAVVALLVSDLPDPGMPAYETTLHDTLAEVITAAQGRTLVLFTSHQAVRAASAALRPMLADEDILVLAQGVDGSPSRLLRLLMQRPRSVILGTAAFWEGVDVRGDALSQIVIARLPFPVPNDPIYEGRAERFDDPFQEFALPQSVLRFRQGFGRLIRSTEDRGAFVVLDSRIVRRKYGPTFLDGLPDCEVRTLRADAIPSAVAAWLA